MILLELATILRPAPFPEIRSDPPKSSRRSVSVGSEADIERDPIADGESPEAGSPKKFPVMTSPPWSVKVRACVEKFVKTRPRTVLLPALIVSPSPKPNCRRR